MDFFNQHIEQVKQLALKVKKPSKLTFLMSGFLFGLSFISIIPMIICLIVGIIIIYFYPETASILFFIAKICFYISLIGFIISIYLIKKYFKDVVKFKNTSILREDFKLNILPQLIQNKYPEIYYKFDGIVNEKHILDSDLFSENLVTSLKEETWFFGDDFFKGKIENVDFEFCELYYKTHGFTTFGWIAIVSALFFAIIKLDFLFEGNDDFGDFISDNNSKSDKKSIQNNNKHENNSFLHGTKTNFRGFFLYADFHKDFIGEVRIKTKNKIPFSNLFNFKDKNLHKIIPENTTIHKKYTIVATDLQLGYYVLSPIIIEAIETLNKKFVYPFSVH